MRDSCGCIHVPMFGRDCSVEVKKLHLRSGLSRDEQQTLFSIRITC